MNQEIWPRGEFQNHNAFQSGLWKQPHTIGIMVPIWAEFLIFEKYFHLLEALRLLNCLSPTIPRSAPRGQAVENDIKSPSLGNDLDFRPQALHLWRCSLPEEASNFMLHKCLYVLLGAVCNSPRSTSNRLTAQEIFLILLLSLYFRILIMW